MARSLEAAIGGKLAVAAAILLAVIVGIRMGGLPSMSAPAAQVRPAAPAVVAAPAPPKPAPLAALPAAPVAPADEPFVIKRILDVPKPFRHGDYAWDDAGVPAGPLIITVDLAAQVLSVFRDGYEIGAAVILHGDTDKPTPLGVFPITQKDATHVSNLYNAPMPYMLRLTNDGISIHGSEVHWNYATHGCIGVPVKFARMLFAQAKLGDRVIVTDGERLGMGERIPAA
jgi:lipoprotein-anchoring transpeptidase ErfK/SrfK